MGVIRGKSILLLNHCLLCHLFDTCCNSPCLLWTLPVCFCACLFALVHFVYIFGHACSHLYTLCIFFGNVCSHLCTSCACSYTFTHALCWAFNFDRMWRQDAFEGRRVQPSSHRLLWGLQELRWVWQPPVRWCASSFTAYVCVEMIIVLWVFFISPTDAWRVWST